MIHINTIHNASPPSVNEIGWVAVAEVLSESRSVIAYIAASRSYPLRNVTYRINGLTGEVFADGYDTREAAIEGAKRIFS